MSDRSQSLTLLKLGGSLITDKSRPRALREDTLIRLAGEIATARQKKPAEQLIIGHGAGSFAHVSAKRHGTRLGVHTPEQWKGFAEVWWDAATLNKLVTKAFVEAGLPVIVLPPSASIIARDGEVSSWDLSQLKNALSAGVLPIIYGDVIFDLKRGGTILSTEDLFAHLARKLQPQRLLFAGIEPGVWKDYPKCSEMISKITPANHEEFLPALSGSAATDVTGGMESKVQQSVELIRENPALEILIFSGDVPENLEKVLLGESLGTVICNA